MPECPGCSDPRRLNTSRLGASQGGGPGWADGVSTPEEFRQRAAQLVLDSRRSIREVAAELGVNPIG
jgi:hypothetical protein